MNCATALCVSCCGRNLGEFNVSETELPLPSLPTEGAASDFVLNDYFLTNSLFLPNLQHYKHLSSRWSHHPTHFYSRAPSQMTAVISIMLTVHLATFHTRGCSGVYPYLAGRVREMRSFRLEVLKFCCAEMRSASYHQSDGESGSCVSLGDPPGPAAHARGSQHLPVPGHPAGAAPPAACSPPSLKRFQSLQLPRVKYPLKNRVRRTFLVLRYTTSCWFLSSLLCLNEAELVNYSDYLIMCSILAGSFSVILHKVFPSVNIISSHTLASNAGSPTHPCTAAHQHAPLARILRWHDLQNWLKLRYF